jgi:hypothetical protein
MKPMKLLFNVISNKPINVPIHIKFASCPKASKWKKKLNILNNYISMIFVYF